MNWDYLIKMFKADYYTQPIVQLTSLLTIIVYLRSTPSTRSAIYLFLIAFASFFQALFVEFFLVFNFKGIRDTSYDQKAMQVYLIIELICCGLYIINNIQSLFWKKVVGLSAVLFCVYMIRYGVLNFAEKIVPLHIEVTEGLLILLYCLYYFYELFSGRPDNVLHLEPSFWAISGMLILFSATTPFFLFYGYLRKIHSSLASSLYTISNVAYGLLFISFTIAIYLSAKRHPAKIL